MLFFLFRIPRADSFKLARNRNCNCILQGRIEITGHYDNLNNLKISTQDPAEVVKMLEEILTLENDHSKSNNPKLSH